MNTQQRIANTKPGFTLIEGLIIIAIIGVLGAITFGALSPSNEEQLLKGATESVVAVVQDARARTLAAKNDQQYGVRFENDRVILFVGGTYSADAPTNEVERLPRRVTISDVSLDDGGSTVVFERLTGSASASGTVTLELAGSSPRQTTVTITTTGVVSG